MPIKDQ
jgi:superoxide oxidase